MSLDRAAESDAALDMPVIQFQCAKCGLVGTRVGSTVRFVQSVDFENWKRLCLLAAQAGANGETVDPRAINCPHLAAAAAAPLQSDVQPLAGR